MEIINLTLINSDVTIFYCRADIFKYLYFPSTIIDTSHIPSTMTLAKYCAEAFKPHDIGTYLFSLTPSFSNELLGSVKISFRIG